MTCSFAVALRLATDSELIARQLFEPLMMQMIHWFTKNVSYESPETMTLLDTIIAGVGDGMNSNLRDFSAKCLSEFLHWSIKQVQNRRVFFLTIFSTSLPLPLVREIRRRIPITPSRCLNVCTRSPSTRTLISASGLPSL